MREHRTQAERRAASRAALLEAAVDCLIKDGYANLTTRRVAERAGVSQGTQMHYFPTKTQFLTEAIRHVAQRLAQLKNDLAAVICATARPRHARRTDRLVAPYGERKPPGRGATRAATCDPIERAQRDAVAG